MAEAGTLTGELQRAWLRFWHARWLVKGPVFVLLAIVILGIIGAASGGGSSKKTASAAVANITSTPTIAATVTSQPVSTATPKPTQAPNPTNTRAPTATKAPPSPAPTPTLAQQVEKSYRDNAGFIYDAWTGKATFTPFPDTGLMRIDFTDTKANGSGGIMSDASASGIVASKAFFSTYPWMTDLDIRVSTDFIDKATGAKTTDFAIQLTVTRDQAATFDYDGLKNLYQQDNKLFVCSASSYQIDFAIYQGLGDPGCLAQYGGQK